MSERDARFYVAASRLPHAGRGVFAKTALARGDRLEVVGVLVGRGSVSDRCTRYADAHKYRVGSFLLIPVGYGGMVNHSSRPNLEKVIEGTRLWLRALRPIRAGEELLVSYSAYARARFTRPRRWTTRGRVIE
jgi:hypothetical protein